MSDAVDSVPGSHWERVWATKPPETLSWFESAPTTSLQLIETHASPSNSVIDIGGGSSRLAGCLYANGYRDISVLDISQSALAINRQHFNTDTAKINWIVADVTSWSATRAYDVWHDRAVFHFLVADTDVEHYVATCAAAVSLDGLLVVGTFGPNGPQACSGLPVQRRSITALSACFARDFMVVDTAEATHRTPNGSTQELVFIAARRIKNLPS